MSDPVDSSSAETGRRSVLVAGLREFGVPFLILVYSVVHFWQVESLGHFTASLSVRVLLVAIVVLCGVIAVGLVSRVVRRLRGADVSIGLATGTAEYGDEDGTPGFSWMTTSFAASIFAYIGLLPYLGFLLTTVLFLVVATFMLGSRSILSLVIVPIVLTVSTYLVFGNVLNIRLPVGRLFG